MNKYTREEQAKLIHGNWEDKAVNQFKSQLKRIGSVIGFVLFGWLVG